MRACACVRVCVRVRVHTLGSMADPAAPVVVLSNSRRMGVEALSAATGLSCTYRLPCCGISTRGAPVGNLAARMGMGVWRGVCVRVCGCRGGEGGGAWLPHEVW